jgi:hypothetical protein
MMQRNHRYERQLPEEPGKSQRRLFVWIATGALLVIALGAVAVALLRTAERQPAPVVNLGVVAAKQYLTEYHTDREKLADPAAVALGERLMKEPFEIGADITLSSDDLPAELGLPLTRLLLGVDIKYDMRDLGAKLRVLGMEYFSAYLIEDEVVVRVPSGAYSMPLDVPEDTDLSQSMGLGSRAMSFAPLMTGDEDFYGRIADMAAQVVPPDATVIEELSGAQAGGEKVIQTELDEAAMQSVLAGMGELLKEDAALRARAEEIFSRTADYYNLDQKTLKQWLISVADGSALADDFELCWKVYERQGRYVGLDVRVTNAGQATEWHMRTELDGKVSHETFSLSVNGKMVQSAEYTVTYRSGGAALDGRFMPDAARTIKIIADIDVEPDGDEYRLTGTVEIEGPVLSEKPVKLSADINAKIRTGEELTALKDDSDWNDVYGEQWEPLEVPLKDLILPRM